MSEPEPQGDQYELRTFLRRVLSVPDPQMRRRQISRHLYTVDEDTAARHLEELLRRACRGDEQCGDVLLPLAEFVLYADAEENARLDAVDLAARRLGLFGVAWYLLEPAAAREIDARALQGMRVESRPLGVRKAAAALRDQRMLERLLYDDEPMVIEKLIMNPRVLQPQIMTIVTRRPTAPIIINTVAANAKWLRNPLVREGITQNPYGDTGLALRLLPTLRRSVWASIPHASEPHPALKAFAKVLLAWRRGEAEVPAPETLR